MKKKILWLRYFSFTPQLILLKRWNADINDAMLNAKTGYTSILYQSSFFIQHCRIFAPRYRQVHLSAFFVNNAESKAAFDTAYADLKRAFSGREHRRKQANLLS